MEEYPSLFFKFRSLSGESGVQRVLNIIEKNELYFPSRAELNDPFEAVGSRLHILGGGYAGISIAFATEQETAGEKMARSMFRILSLSEECFSPNMWGLYADSGRGLCLCYRTDKSFNVAKKVEYPNVDESIFKKERIVRIEDLEEVVKDDLFFKNHDWIYEKEWRIIKKAESEYDNKFSYGEEELVAIIFGYNMNDTLEKMIHRFVPQSVKLFKAHVAKQSRQLIILPYEYMIQYDGTQLMEQKEVVRSVPELSNSVFGGERTIYKAVKETYP